MDQQPSVYNHVTERRNVKHTYVWAVLSEFCFAKSYARGCILPSWRHSFALQRTTSGWTWTTLERWTQKDRFREGVTHAGSSVILSPYVLPLIVHVHARQQITRKPNILHLLQQTLRHNKASLMDVPHFTFRQLLTRRELSKMNETTKCQGREKSEKRVTQMKVQKTFGHRCQYHRGENDKFNF